MLLGLREAEWPVVAYDQDESRRKELKAQGLPVIDSADSLEAPDVFIVATPPETIAEWAIQLLKNFPDSVVTDTGSVKCLIDDQVRDALSEDELERWVPGHPLSGSAEQGYKGADPSLFQGQRWLLCAQDGNGSALSVVEGMIRSLGAKPSLISCEDHDSLLAWSSHLPHVTAAALQVAVSEAAGDQLKHVAGTGLKDATRLAAMDPWLWRSILIANRGNVIQAISGLEEKLAELKQALEGNSPEDLTQWLSQAALDRSIISNSRGWDAPSVD